MSQCIFCKIARGESPADVLYRDEQLLVLKDINPQAPVHLLVIPVEHYPNLQQASANSALVSALIKKCTQLGSELGSQGYRIVVNTGPDGGQTVDHLHIHVLAGRPLQWPPG
ncbi:MAG: histidine triad nucleotide-binding protein [Firmicutes bacterium]|nr:histidine triad nucleotide-binding protein [Bacillota bacterium]